MSSVVVELRGKLGNNIFQFATGYALARRTGADLRFYNPRPNWTAAPALAEMIGELYQEATPQEVLRFGRVAARHGQRRRDDTSHAWATWLAVRSTRLGLFVQSNPRAAAAYDPRVTAAKPPVLLDGFFQNERFFEDYADEISGRLVLPTVPDALNQAPRPWIGVSFRRGDYLTHGVALPLSFYESALTSLTKEVEPGTFLVTSDDPAFAELAVPWVQRFGPVVQGTDLARSAVGQLSLLAACDYSVVANSTFSWWGGWLAERRQGGDTAAGPYVYAPAGWMTGQQEVLPGRWSIVSYS